MKVMKISADVRKYENFVIEQRRKLHAIPELAEEEKETAAYIEEQLRLLRPDSLERLFRTGVKAVFLAKNPKKTIGLRADMDALPVQEPDACPFRSVHEGRMHACGHDGHMAIMLGMAALIAQKRDQLENNYVLIFQPAEEADGGAQPMMDEGALENPKVDEVYGLHIWPYLEAGKIGIKPGPLMAGMRDINVDIIGKSAHGARPQHGTDAVVAAAQFVNQAQTIISRNVDPVDTAVLTLGVIKGGEARNIVCDRVHMEGTLRTFDDGVADMVKGRLYDILSGLEKGMGVETRCYETMAFPAVVNDRALTQRAKERLDESDIAHVEKVMISEDFSCYQRKVPGLFVFLGVRDEGHDAPLHTKEFGFDEKYLLTGMEYVARMAGLSDEK